MEVESSFLIFQGQLVPILFITAVLTIMRVDFEIYNMVSMYLYYHLQGIDFANFTAHMFVGIVFTTFAGYGLLRVYYRNLDALKNKDPPEISGMINVILFYIQRQKFIRGTIYISDKQME